MIDVSVLWYDSIEDRCKLEAKAVEVKTYTCPICNDKHVKRWDENAFFPFCSEKCSLKFKEECEERSKRIHRGS